MSPLKALLSAALALAIWAPAALAAQSNDPDELNAAIVFNILRFVEFPGREGRTLTMCVDRRASAAPELLALGTQSSRGLSLRTRSVSGERYAGCDIVYLARSDASLIDRASQRGRLVMGDGTRFVEAGGAIGLVRTGAQVRFEVNLREADAAGLTISSRLIRLAARVRR